MKTLVLIHGHGVDASIWEGIKPLLEEYQVLTPDFSTDTKYKSIEEYADGLYEWLGEVGVKKCVLIGHSMGGYLALAFAEKYPELLLVLAYFTPPLTPMMTPKPNSAKKTLTFMETHGAAAFIRQSAPNMYSETFSKDNPDVIKSHIEKYSELPTEAVVAGFKAIMIRPDRTAILRDTKVPVLFIFGEQDKLISFEKNIDLSKLSPNSHTLILKEAGHMGMAEDPATSADTIKDFMEKV